MHDPQYPLVVDFVATILEICGNPSLVLTIVTVAAECSFGILSKFISPPGWKTRMDAVLAGDLS